MENKSLLKINNMYKWFDATQALKGVDLEIQGGQIHGLIGENGSGKSTITSIIAGVKMPTEGRMFFKGQPWEPSSMASAFDCGVSMILQEANTIPGCTVAENLYAGHISKFRKYGFLDSRKMVRKASEKLADFGVSHIDAAGLVDQYGFEDRKVVEIVRSLSSSTELLIIDETTTALSHEGRKMLYSIMHKMKEEGKAVIFISHDIDEIIEHCTNLTVLRDGEITGHLSYEDLQKDDAIERIRFLMVGRDIGDAYYREDYDSSHEEEIALEFKDVSVSGVKNFNLQLHKGEIIGFGGLSGSGMHEIGRAAFGLEKLASGKVIRNEQIIKSPHDAIRGSIGYISKDRDVEALILSGDVRDNIALPSLDGLSRFSFIHPSKEKELVEAEIESLNIKCYSGKQLVGTLSGGNKQKVSFAKWTANDSDVIVMDCPTRGVDVGVKQSMYAFIAEMKKQGKAVLMISEELPELIGMSDRIFIMKDDKVQKIFERHPDLKESDLIEYMI